MAAICAKETAGVDVKLSSQSGGRKVRYLLLPLMTDRHG
jgi:hypothetical protein